MNIRMPSSFSAAEWRILTEDYRLTKMSSPDRSLSVPSLDLLDTNRCRSYMEGAAEIFGTTVIAAAASQFSKRYAYMTMASGLYAMTMFDKALDYSLENCRIESVYQGSSWLPEVRLSDWQVSSPAAEGRKEWRDQVVSRIFAGNIAKVWRSIAAAARIPASTLWENMAISVYWLYEKRMVEGADESGLRRIEEDLRYLLEEAPAELFGERENPLMKYNNAETVISSSGEPKRKRRTCCLLYKVSGSSPYCVTCPLAGK
ncbi:hypothetical protein DNH61_18050 [Paenibacillus sambharensis]|uniref:Aerobactin siderophore biosynthesis IucA/IucC-like C-terminal domain-containing protein n=1 Tax=Paenibacillus sambharensis TaxID=1803190 RepID=A0A2W1LIE3_9BACL|nr:IucA/IucC family C-terminal-domain containing protein [Paenibacillus sambharensis]PZD94314.1 hypothetical protein DNH61_18050 [Paenibacillus sambharensis]